MEYCGRERRRSGTGTAVEVLASSDQSWHIGWVLEDTGGILQVLVDDGSTERIRPDDARLAPVGRSITVLPPQTKVVERGHSPPVIVHQPSGRQYTSLEEAWSAHYSVFSRSSGQPALNGGPRPSDLSIPVVYESELDFLRAENKRQANEIARLASLCEDLGTENARITALNEELEIRVSELKVVEREVRAERDQARAERDQARRSSEKGAGGASRQPHRHVSAGWEARSEGLGQRESAPMSSSRAGEQPVQVVVSMPRALTPEELVEEAAQEEARTVPPVRSVRNLAHTVVRMTSAPLTSHSSSLAMSTAASPHSVRRMPTSSQALQPVPTVHTVAAAPSAAATQVLTAQSARAPTAVSPTLTTRPHKVISYRR